jgi:cephalosporin hydroxylase
MKLSSSEVNPGAGQMYYSYQRNRDFYNETTPEQKMQISAMFHNMYYDSQVWVDGTSWKGHTIEKNPFDLWMYQMLIWDLKPDVIVELGTWKGGSAIYFADILDFIGKGKLLTIDKKAQEVPVHPRVTYLEGKILEPEIVQQARDFCEGAETVLVIADSDHSADHVLNEARLYAPLVTSGSYYVVEDANAFPPHQGPWPAVQTYLQEDSSFEIDKSCERFFMTFNPGGWLKKK